LVTNKSIKVFKIISLIIIFTLLLIKDKKNKYFLLFVSLFLLSIFLETFFFLLIKFERFDLLEIFVNKLPFLREPVAKIE
jgi:hypothetical protein